MQKQEPRKLSKFVKTEQWALRASFPGSPKHLQLNFSYLQQEHDMI